MSSSFPLSAKQHDTLRDTCNIVRRDKALDTVVHSPVFEVRRPRFELLFVQIIVRLCGLATQQ
ncbi:hypothetical protein [Armatimonas sp.]|uniref:hypothetical protein n=1 Tax=Armatimonas sp. TaxID=1872638 RepID=UPI00374DF4C9